MREPAGNFAAAEFPPAPAIRVAAAATSSSSPPPRAAHPRVIRPVVLPNDGPPTRPRAEAGCVDARPRQRTGVNALIPDGPRTGGPCTDEPAPTRPLTPAHPAPLPPSPFRKSLPPLRQSSVPPTASTDPAPRTDPAPHAARPDPASLVQTQFAWPALGVALAIGLVGVLRPPMHRDLSLAAGWTLLAAEVVGVAILSATPAGTRMAVLLSGLLLPLAAYVSDTPLARALLACFGGLPFVTATLLLDPRAHAPRAGESAADGAIARLGGRLAFICSIGGVVAQRRPRGLDLRALLHLALATAVLAAAITAVKTASSPAADREFARNAATRDAPTFAPAPERHGATSHNGAARLALRWFAGGIGMLAIGEMLTACLPLVATALGITTSPLFRSPARSTSLADFWARRWNVRASAFFLRYTFAPLVRPAGIGVAVSFTFLMSALGHAFFADIALGRRPALSAAAFFLAQPLLLAAERRLRVRRHWPPLAGWLWTMSALAVTSPLLIEPILQTITPSWGPPSQVIGPTAAGVAFVLVVSTATAVASRWLAGEQV